MDTGKLQRTMEKLGAALYTHIKLGEKAMQAEQAVEYLADQGVFSNTEGQGVN
jgi:hypothetical protein